MVKHYTQYEAVKRYPVIRGYLDHFRRVSKDNDIPGFLSFFFIQGQLAAPYVRIPMDNIHLDPRIHVFWIQGSRSGKSVSWGVINKLMKELDLETDVYTEGTDAGLIGSWERVEGTERGESEMVLRPGLLAGQKALNFDEGSLLLKPGKFSQNTVLYLQTACNSIGSEENIMRKHNVGDPIEIESMVSLWITTYPPDGVKEYVLHKGIFQRVLLFWRTWGMDLRQNISEERAVLPWGKIGAVTMDYDKIAQHFKDLRVALISRILSLSDISMTEWNAMDRPEQEDIVQACARTLFTKDETFNATMLSCVDDYYTLVRGMDPKLAEVVASFIPGILNYTIILATHLAMVERVWEVTGDHVIMAEEILFDLFQNLILWLEEEVEVGAKASERRAKEAAWKEAFKKVEKFDLGDRRGTGWARKSQVLELYGKARNLSSNSCFTHFKRAEHLFQSSREGPSIYCRLREEYEK